MRARIHATQPVTQRAEVLAGHQVRLGNEQPVGEAHLLLRLVVLVELLRRVNGVHHRDDAVQPEVLLHRLVHEERLGHRRRVREPRGLDDHAIKAEAARRAPVREVPENADQVAAHLAADAAVVHLDDLLVLVLHEQLVVDAGLAEFVLDHRDAVAVLVAQDAVEQRCLAAAQEAGEDGDGNAGIAHGALDEPARMRRAPAILAHPPRARRCDRYRPMHAGLQHASGDWQHAAPDRSDDTPLRPVRAQPDEGGPPDVGALLDPQVQWPGAHDAVLEQVSAEERGTVAGGGVLPYAVGHEEKARGDVVAGSLGLATEEVGQLRRPLGDQRAEPREVQPCPTERIE